MLEQPISAEHRAQLGRMPFNPPTPGNEFAQTKKLPVMRAKLGETVPDGDDSLQKAVATVPFVGATIGAGIVAVPRLSLAQYASLRAELALWPTRSGEILLQYYVVNEAARRALMEHWEAELAASPEARAMFEKDFAAYTAWLRSPRAELGFMHQRTAAARAMAQERKRR